MVDAARGGDRCRIPRAWSARLLVLLALLALVLGAGCGPDYVYDGSGGGSPAVTVAMSEWAITPPVIEAPAGAPLVVEVTNAGEVEHDFTLENGEGTERIKPGDTETVDLGDLKEETIAFCSIPGHRENGMEAVVRVAG